MRSARERALVFVPRVHATDAGDTSICVAGRSWDLTDWMPGRADFHESPSREKIEAACIALALLHEAWSTESAVSETYPAIDRRRECLREWLDLWQRGWRPDFSRQPGCVEPSARRALALLHEHLPRLPPLLSSAPAGSVSVQPCLCDIWHEHVLFTNDTVTGIVDYGSMKVDHVAADLARLLGSLAEDDTELRRAGLQAYRRVRSLSDAAEELVDALDRSGTILALTNWLRWLYHQGRCYDDPAAVAARLQTIVRRVERWSGR
jgi:Ser/Thr protein kinase RdoA (MazF antagonist)